MSEGCYDDDYKERSGRGDFSSLGRTHTPIVTDGEISEVKVYNTSNQLIRIETYIYQASKTGKSGKWELHSKVPVPC
ncbi:MAG: hypothetical protein ACK5MU_02080 [Candidatus Saccharimonadales bacterium]